MTEKKDNRTPFQKHVTIRPTDVFDQRKVKGQFGIEIELEGEGLPLKAPPGWSTREEGSLRGPHCEYATNGSVPFEAVAEHVDSLSDYLSKNKVKIQESYRTSTHIHVNLQQESFDTILGVLVVYYLVEPLFMKLASQGRDGNLFCLSSYDTGDAVEHFSNMVNSIKRTGGYYRFNSRGKYAAMNTDPIVHFGSFEFRMFPSTLSGMRIQEWAEWIKNIVTIAREEKDKTFHTFTQNAMHNPLPIARCVFNTLPQHVFDRLPVEEYLKFGLETSYEMMRLLRAAYKDKTKRTRKKKPNLDEELLYFPDINEVNAQPVEQDEPEEDREEDL